MQAGEDRLGRGNQSACPRHADDGGGAGHAQPVFHGDGASGALVHQEQGRCRVCQGEADARRFAFVQLSDPTGLYEVTVFSDTLEQARDYLEPGKNVVLTVEANLEGDTLKLLARGAAGIDAVAAEAGAQALRIHLNRAEAVASVAALFAKVEGRNRAQITLTVPDDKGREIDLVLPQPYPVTPQIKGAVKAISGVVMVEEV